MKFTLFKDTYRRSFLALFLERMIQETLDLEHLRGPEEAVHPVLVHGHLPGVHEVQEKAEVVLPDIPEYDDGVLTWVALKQRRYS